ncbi:hypothetical protein TNIN_242791 [Trichonephila inaurata madagascariensis]|uniref:Uncharacterized protein n=1 Tax=Trichonephila inaurata madagascariensis TaxID=2747483 RepID=A0A8X6XFV2_9ARAC|nr:hypothetical protein TNIN_242791 [Trichonephila inaurata madagascariensis]
MKYPVNPHHTVNLEECRGFSVQTHGFDVDQMRQLWVCAVHNMLRRSKRNLIQFWREPTSQILFSLPYPMVKVHGMAVICMDAD